MLCEGRTDLVENGLWERACFEMKRVCNLEDVDLLRGRLL